MEEIIKRELNTSVFHSKGKGGGGCISQGSAYETDSGTVFVKYNDKPEVIFLV